MESNGKSVRLDGTPVAGQTGEIFWGAPGTNGQHAFYQLIHQGTKLIPADFIAFAEATHDSGEQQDLLMANCLAQTKALAFGKTAAEIEAEGTPAAVVPHKVMPGNRPSSTIFAPKLTPSVLGQLVALYEHTVFVEGCIWGIDSFDQWGVELGKVMAKELAPLLTADSVPDVSAQDSSTAALVKRYRSRARPPRLTITSRRHPRLARTGITPLGRRQPVQWLVGEEPTPGARHVAGQPSQFFEMVFAESVSSAWPLWH